MDGNFSPQPATSNSVPSFNLLDNVRAAVVETKFEVANDNGLAIYRSTFQLGRFFYNSFFEEIAGKEDVYNFGIGLRGDRQITPLLDLTVGENGERAQLSAHTENTFLAFAKLKPTAKVEVGGKDSKYSFEEYNRLRELFESNYDKLKGQTIKRKYNTQVEFKEQTVAIKRGDNVEEIDTKEFINTLKTGVKADDYIRHTILNMLTKNSSTPEEKMYQRVLLYYAFLKRRFRDAVEEVPSEKIGSVKKYHFNEDEEGLYFMVDMSKIAAKPL